MVRHFLEVSDCSADELRRLLELSVELKKLYRGGGRDASLTGKAMVMLFEKPSSRTRLSFQVGMMQLGGSAIYITRDDIGGLGKREPIKDLARVLNGYVNVIVGRVFEHASLVELARYATVPVINALSDLAHPCQAMADILTIQEHFGALAGRKVAFIGDGNNVARSLAVACVRLGLTFAIATPPAYALPDDFLRPLQKEAAPGQVVCDADPRAVVKGADVVYTDTWISMGQEAEKEQRCRDFAGYQVDRDLLTLAGRQARVMHCLPAYRGLEITDEVMESPQSIVFDQAENRLHFQRALLKYLLTP